MTNSSHDVRRTLKGVFGDLARHADAVDSALAPLRAMQRNADAAFQRFQRQHEANLRRTSEIVDRLLQTMSAEARETFPILAARGWFPDLHMYGRDRKSLVLALENGRHRIVDRTLTEWYEKRLTTIQRELISIYPDRAKPIRSALWAHRKRRYYLSIPVCLAQADGICAEILGASPFLKRSGRPATAERIDDSGSIWQSMLLPLTLSLPIAASAKEREQTIEMALNRHQILHGESADYGTRINSAALSLLNYVGVVLKTWKRIHQKAQPAG